MTASKLSYCEQTAGLEAISEHLRRCDGAYQPPLSQRVDIDEYTLKIKHNARTFEAWSDGQLVGLVATYFNGAEASGYVTSVSVDRTFTGLGIASTLMRGCIEHAKSLGTKSMALEVSSGNGGALHLYRKFGFVQTGTAQDSIRMHLQLSEQTMTEERDYNQELKDTASHRYAYKFDFDVMHGYMLESFKPFFRPGKALELGSFKGDFTKRLAPHFDDITCVEASDEAVAIAREKHPPAICSVLP